MDELKKPVKNSGILYPQLCLWVSLQGSHLNMREDRPDYL